jgi:hypothetical protein
VLADEWRENREINAGEYSGRWSTLCGSSKSHMHVWRRRWFYRTR